MNKQKDMILRFNSFQDPLILKKDIKEQKPKRKLTLNDVMTRLKMLNDRGVINALSVQHHYMNANIDYTYVSFRILKNESL